MPDKKSSTSSKKSKSKASAETLPDSWTEYIESIKNHLSRKFQPTIVDEFLKEVEEKGLPHAIAQAVDSKDYTRGDIWAKSQSDVLTPLLPGNPLLGELIKKAGLEGSTHALKWLPEYVGNSKDQKEILVAQLKSNKSENRRWAAIHLSRLNHDKTDESYLEALKEGLCADWVASKQEHSSSGLSGKGETARAIARLGKEGSSLLAPLSCELEKSNLEAADVAQIASALNQVSQDLELALSKLIVPAENILNEKRGMGLHQGEKEMLKTLKNFIKLWNQKASKENKELETKLEFLQREVEYHLPS
ncbi:MAG: hypothetical protein SFY67_12140 [Candidatus Melainabacteria bacterium]|nr:hypothetical protein [Candidatus Melainabacteria bacterium]